MGNVIRVALPTRDALSDTDPSHFSLFSDSDNVLIKEFARGADEAPFAIGDEITHSLGYIPFFLVYGEVASGRYRLANGFPIGGEWRVSADTSKVYVGNQYSSTYESYRYYIFYDNFT